MNKVKTLVLRTAGTNCDMETAHAFRKAGSDARLVHINALVKDTGLLEEAHILAIPGGFTYGDDIASGKILANELKHTLKGEIASFIKRGKLIIGICNGFQVLVKMGLLPNSESLEENPRVEATLTLNNSGKFEARWVYLKREKDGDKCVWTRSLPEVIYLPVAHAEGKFMPEGAKALERIKRGSQVVLRYCGKHGEKPAYPFNPNGSVDDIAGICDTTGRIFGLMPHPERHIDPTQHPNWRRSDMRDNMGVGLQIFENGVNFVREELIKLGG